MVARLGKAVPADDDVRSLIVQVNVGRQARRRRLPDDQRQRRLGLADHRPRGGADVDHGRRPRAPRRSAPPASRRCRSRSTSRAASSSSASSSTDRQVRRGPQRRPRRHRSAAAAQQHHAHARHREGLPEPHGRRDREQLPAAAHGGPDRRRDRRGPDRRRGCRWHRDAVAEHPRNHHDRSDLWSQPDERDQRHLALPGGAPAVAGGHPPGRRGRRRADAPRQGPGARAGRGSDRRREGRQGRRAGRGSDRDRGLRRRPQRPPPGARLAQGPLQAQGHPDPDARSPRPPRRRDAGGAGDRRVDRRDRRRRPRSTGASPAPDTATPGGPQEEEVRAVRAVGALRRRPTGRPPRKRRQAPAGPAVRTTSPC